MGDSKLFDDIKKLAKDIIELALPIMKELVRDDNDFVEDILDEREDLDRDVVAGELRDRLIFLTQDANVILTELESFKKDFLEDSICSEVDQCSYPFLFEVWSGDSYGESERDGLKLLINDLEMNLSNLDEDQIINFVLEKL